MEGGCINLLAWKREAILVNKGGGQCKIESGFLLGLEEKIAMHKLLSKRHDVMYKKLSPCAQLSGEEYRGRTETSKAGDYTEFIMLSFSFLSLLQKGSLFWYR